jgi:four helix bundle protein
VIQLTPQLVATDGYRTRRFAYARRIGFAYPLPMHAYENLDAWKAAHALGLAVWRLTEGWAGQDAVWMRDEMRTVAFRAPLRIVHGAGRLLRKPFQRHVDMALGYLMELHYLLRRAEELGLLSGTQRRELDGLRGRAFFYTTRLFVSLASNAEEGG